MTFATELRQAVELTSPRARKRIVSTQVVNPGRLPLTETAAGRLGRKPVVAVATCATAFESLAVARLVGVDTPDEDAASEYTRRYHHATPADGGAR